MTCGKKDSFESDAYISEMLKNVSSVESSANSTSADGYTFLDNRKVFKMELSSGDQSAPRSSEVTSKKFRVLERMQLMIEVFYEPYFYDLELTIFSRMSDIEHSNIDLTLYKGSKSVFIELEAGDYELKLTFKSAPWPYDTSVPAPLCAEF